MEPSVETKIKDILEDYNLLAHQTCEFQCPEKEKETQLLEEISSLFSTQQAQMEYLLLQEYAHPTEDGYCCACDYDIAVLERQIEETKAQMRDKVAGLEEDEYGMVSLDDVLNILE